MLWLSCSLITVMFLLLCVWLFSAFSFVSVVIILLLGVLLFIAFSFVSVDKCGNLHFINYCKTNRLSNYCHCIIKIVICDVQATTEKLFPNRRIILQSDHTQIANVNFKLISLNARGIRDFQKRKAIFSWIKKQNADIAFLQETYSTPEIVDEWKFQWH